ncbi:MAG: hypothetical protein JXA89_07635, partial [Anaerolineae bacterium]|nr:hypothetical protein [Anaerolineae bacterium]
MKSRKALIQFVLFILVAQMLLPPTPVVAAPPKSNVPLPPPPALGLSDLSIVLVGSVTPAPASHLASPLTPLDAFRLFGPADPGMVKPVASSPRPPA